ncbi:hypothetical protein BBJ28_00002958 [Nothophytophthora sp. Chile5]|nr:hypothetical protein BBJ28_00002958 [Nothophytophthora sp. Chile5]
MTGLYHSILYQRGIYPAESFKQVQKYGLNMLVTDDEKLSAFFTNFLSQLSSTFRSLRLPCLFVSHSISAPTSKPRKEIMAEIQAIIRQITASVSFLPLLEEQCAFDLLVYTDKNSEVPALWEESDPRYIKDSAEVRLRSFSTRVHKVDAMVAYKNPEADI